MEGKELHYCGWSEWNIDEALHTRLSLPPREGSVVGRHLSGGWQGLDRRTGKGPRWGLVSWERIERGFRGLGRD